MGAPGHISSRTLALACAATLLLSAPAAIAGLPALPVEKWRYVFAERDPTHPRGDTLPLVVQLDDDDGDGAVTSRDIPDVLFTAPQNISTSLQSDVVAVN